MYTPSASFRTPLLTGLLMLAFAGGSMLAVAPASAQTFQGGLFYDAATNELVIKVKPSGNVSTALQNIVFTLQQPVTNAATLGTPTGAYGIAFQETTPVGAFTYSTYACQPCGTTLAVAGGTEVEIARIPVTGGSGTQTAMLAPTATDPQGDNFYVENGTGMDVTNNATPYYNNLTTLPVELTGLRVAANGPSVLLSWTTQTETNNAGFGIEARQVERKGAGAAAWKQLTFLEGAGTTAEAQRYSYQAEGLRPGQYLFRLRQVDLDGTAAYSPEVEALIEAPRVLALMAPTPHPVRTDATLNFTVAENGAVSVELYDILGRQVAVLFKGEAAAGQTHQAFMPVQELSAGVYVARLQHGDLSRTQVITVVR